jgi:UDP-N-acetylmuramate: L-alanyl-gamma-D-glutamyl-meso-diaminopimelate ligase
LLNKKDEEVPIQVFGEHNLRNISAAKEVCKQLGIKGKDFLQGRGFFPGARDAELVREGATSVVYKDFAHAPSKLKATAAALKQQFPARRAGGLPGAAHVQQPQPALFAAVRALLRCARRGRSVLQPGRAGHKRLPPLAAAQVAEAFQRPQFARVHTTAGAGAYLEAKPG